MVKVILDSNFLFVPFKFRINIFGELEGLLGKIEPIVLSTTVEELEKLTRRRSTMLQKQAEAALELVKKCQVVEVKKKPKEGYDDVIFRTAKEWGSPVATNDTKLRKKLRETGISAVFLRQKSHLEIEGYLP